MTSLCYQTRRPSYRKPLACDVVEDQAGDALGGRIAVEDIDRLAELLQRGNERVS
jgi:hypothetical protein